MIQPPAMWKHQCPVDGGVLDVGVGEPCNWCQMTEPADSNPWEAEHKRRVWGLWPNESMIRFVMRSFGHHRPRREVRILDFGCGAGASSRFLRSEGFDVRAIDGSRSAVNRTNELIHDEGFGGFLFSAQVADCGSLPWTEPTFDCVIDVCCLQHIDDIDIKPALREIARVLKPAGRLFSRHVSSHSYAGLSVVGSIYPRQMSKISDYYSKFFDCDYMHDAQERRHPTQLKRKVVEAHWNIEGVKRDGNV